MKYRPCIFTVNHSFLQAPTMLSTPIPGLTASYKQPRSPYVSTKPLTILLRPRLAFSQTPEALSRIVADPDSHVFGPLGSGSISQRHGSEDPDLNPHQNVMDPQHCFHGFDKHFLGLNVYNLGNHNMMQCCESGMFIPDPDFYPSRIQNSNKREGRKKLVILFYVATNFAKLKIILVLKC